MTTWRALLLYTIAFYTPELFWPVWLTHLALTLFSVLRETSHDRPR